MAFGTADRLKSDIAEGVSLVIGRLAVRRAGRIALLTCGAPVAQQDTLRAAGARGTRRAAQGARQGVAPDGHAPTDALAEGMRRVGRLARGHSLVVVVSDFRDER